MTDFQSEQTVHCALCSQTITGRPQDMTGNRRWKYGVRAWYSNALSGRTFALCPAHRTTENITAQFAKVGVGP